MTYLSKFNKNDCDIDSIAIYLNPNYETYIPIKEVTTFHAEIRKVLYEFVDKGFVEKEDVEILSCVEEDDPIVMSYEVFSIRKL